MARTLDNDCVLGQMYDYLRIIEILHGTRPVFGIVTTHNHWRVCWLGDVRKEGPGTPVVKRVQSAGAMFSPMPGCLTPAKKQG